MKRSHAISGLGALAMITLPLVGAVVWSGQSLEYVRNIEKRTPAAWPRFERAGDLIDSKNWQQANRAINDRVPWRGRMQQAKLDIETRLLGERLLGPAANQQVGLGRDGWLFVLSELGQMTGTSDQVAYAIGRVEAAAAEDAWRARLILVPAPDKNSIYPEQLNTTLRRMLEPHIENRATLRAWFRQIGAPDRVDTWSYFERAKPSAPEPLYEPTGSHHSSFGSMLLAQAMIDAVDTSLWDEQQITHTATLTYQSDLSKLAGYTERTESWDRYEIVRPGVELETFLHDGSVLEGVDRPPPGSGPGVNNRPARYINKSSGASLIPGRTLIVHDSFIAEYLRPTLRQFFEDVSFIHYNLIKPGDLQDALRDFDLVYFEFVERGARQSLQGFFTDTTPANNHLILRRVEMPNSPG